MNRSFRAPERGHTGSLTLKDNRDDDLALFREMRKRDKERNNLLLLQNSDEFDAPLGHGTSPIFNIPSATSAPGRKTGADDFLNSDNDKNDYDWLLTPPGTPLFPSLEKEHHKTVMSHLGTPKARPTALKSRLANPQLGPTSRNNLPSREASSSPGLNTSTGGLRRPSSSGGSGSRPSTPTGRPTLASTARPTSSSTSTKKPVASKPASSNILTRSAPAPLSKPSRPSTPTSRPMLSSSSRSVRSSTPTLRPTARPSTPTPARPPALAPPPTKPPSRSSTPTRRPVSGLGSSTPAIKSPTASSVSARPSSNHPRPSSLHSGPSRPSSPTVQPRMWKPSDMPGFSLEAPPNLRTSIADRPPSATRGRPGSSGPRSVDPISTGRVRRQSCSPARGRLPNGIVTHNSGSSVPVPTVNRLHAKANDNVSPVLVGTKMVERVVNMRKLVPPKQDGKNSPRSSNLSGKSSSSPDSLGLGRTLSKKSLDMAIRHMDLRRTIPGNLRPLMNNIPASSMYSVRSGPARRPSSVLDSPLGTSSNASSELSVNNNALCVDGHEVDDDVSSSKVIRSPASLHGR